jgi:gliding motility-associated-like protein
MFSQQIVVDGSVGLQQLIEDNLVKNSCVDITNITSSVNGSASGFSSYAYFERGPSNFPFENGIMLATGNATSGGNSPITPILSEGSTSWGTDPDLEVALGISNTLNATSIEFDVMSISNQLQFNYLLASEEYFGINPCQFSDGFVFLIKPTGSSGPYQNIALVPGTSTPVNTNTIHDEIYGVCPAQNAQYFDTYGNPDTNYNGRTTVLTASATITPNVQYHIKLIIADQTDGTFDSAVFIEGNSFKILDLGPDIATCASSTTLTADIQNALASYAWYLNGTLIPAAISPTLNVIQSGTYKVEVSVPFNSINCVEDDEIEVVLNTEEPIPPISNYELCDENGNGIREFNLITKNIEVTNAVGNTFSNFTFSYHYTLEDARIPSNEITTPISNTGSPTPIYVRIEDLDSDCFAYTTFDLIVNSIPDIGIPTDLEVCDSDDFPDGSAIIYLTDKDDEITNGQSNFVVSYHSSLAEANNGNNPIQSPTINTNLPSSTVYVRVIDTQTGCVNTASSFNINVTISPIVVRDTRYLDACDQDHDGFATFDLTQVINDIEGGLSGVTTTFHESYADADSGDNPILNPTNYQNTNFEEQTLYVRVQDDVTGCASIVPLEIHTNLLLTATDTGDYALCDNNEIINDTLPFNLNSIETFIANDLPFPISVTFYDSPEARDAGAPAISNSMAYETLSPKILYIKIENTDTGCFEMSEITLLINPVLLFNRADPLPYCDTDDDGIVDIDLHTLDGIVTNFNTSFSATYFTSAIDAENNANEISFFTNTTSVETLYARIENIASSCHTVNSFEIEVVVAPAANTPLDIIICDNDQDGFSIINLDAKISEAVSDRTGLNISVHTSFDDANTDSNPIPNSDLTAYNSNTQTIYIKVEDAISSTRCYAIVSFEVIVNTLPNFPVISNYQICAPNGNTTADFLLVDKDVEILNGQTGKEVFYFEDPAFTIPIDKNSNFTNSFSPQTVYVRVENITDSNCFGTSSFVLQVSPDPVYNPIIDYLVCDDASNDGKNTFDLVAKRNEIAQGSTDNLNISFHLTRMQAEGNLSPLPAQYTNAVNPQTLFVRIESNDSFCSVIEELGINIIAAPDISQVTAPLIECDTDYDGFTPFNLENADFEINDRVQSNLIINYFENLSDINQNDGLDNSNEITNPTTYISNSKTVYIKVANTLTSCFSVIPLELQVNLPPPTNPIGTIPICDNDTDTYDLSLVDNMIVNSINGVTISYHNTQNDADTNINAIHGLFNYTASSHTLYVRVSDNTTSCFITSIFVLQINQNPVANKAPDLISCDDDFDGFVQFDLSANTNAIVGSQDPSNYTLTYYSSLTDAETKANPLNYLHPAYNGEIIYVRLENSNTGCYDTSDFAIRVNPLPIIPINDIVPLCNNDIPLVIDAYTGNTNDTYLWSTGATTPQIILNDASEIGDYWVTVTTPHVISDDCSYTKVISIIESEVAIINFTTTVDFADPNSITVDISGIGDYVYILDDGEPQTSNVFNNVTFGVHLVTIRDLNGCDDVTKEVVVIDIPKFFTPNNDSVFDTWHIVGIEQLPGTVVYIYNRYGKLLKTLPDSIKGWDGTFNGQNMPSDDYWFVAKVKQNGESFDVKGHFALKR